MSGTDAYADGDTVSPPKEPPAVMPGVRVRSEVSVMSETGDRSAFPFDWKAFERMFGGGGGSLPLPDSLRSSFRDTSWIGDYVQRILRHAQSQQGLSASFADIDSHWFETHKSVIFRINVPKETNANLIRVWVSSHHLQLEGIPDTKHKHTFPLPAPVVAKASRAVFKDGVLEIRMPKSVSDKKYREIYVEFEE
jgi:HSP20 family molecular chaperone IbpA